MLGTRARTAVLVSAFLAAAPLAHAQTPPPKPAGSAATADAAFDAQKAAFLALPLPTRVAAQEALVWLGFYNGVSDGDFGKRTRDAIAAFQLAQRGKGDGALTPGQLQALLAAGQKARADAGFQTIVDAKTNAKIDAPTKLMGPKSGTTLDFASDASGDLAALYARLAADGPGRKVGYKAIKPGAFFVVSGQDGGRKFYTRYERDAAAAPPIRGFTFAYPAKRADLDRVALAVANSFVAFPQAAPASAAPSAPPAATPAPAQPKAAATALIVAPGRALTAIKPGDCANPRVGGQPARFERYDPATGLALLVGDFGSGAQAPQRGAPGQDAVVLGSDGSRIAAFPAGLTGGLERSVVAALDRSAAGAPAFDRSGGLVGIVAPLAEEPQRVGGVALAAPHALIAAEAIGSFLGGGALEPIPEAAAPQSVGAIADARAKSVAPVTCGP
ncbi:putative peptidoglycan binding protein [Roseiarcus fermentans]|uniref:Putative peptidoglycan binding protein n=1 Tax=Roseiarcus fermentans TaxID=1473586 RepID=A0A366EEW3_9HYPH|nr:peptidoglycan-binding domain-containing protein [Roseiarcus fermentans]RBP00932.1 putative peptidoglycan binding protein [Roseiarcus fermentans]